MAKKYNEMKYTELKTERARLKVAIKNAIPNSPHQRDLKRNFREVDRMINEYEYHRGNS